MKNLLFLVLGLSLLCVLPSPAGAGPLYGTVRMGPAPARGVEISVACPGFGRPGPAPAPAPVMTDARGSFSLLVPASGRCQMRVRGGNRVGDPFDVFVSQNPLRFDFEIDGAMNRVR